jgi:hypothetical protein
MAPTGIKQTTIAGIIIAIAVITTPNGIEIAKIASTSEAMPTPLVMIPSPKPGRSPIGCD